MKKYIVELSHEEREKLQGVIRAERMAAHKRLHAQMLLKLDQGPEGPGWTDAQVAKAYDCQTRTAEAHLIALACTEAPQGRNRWTVRLLADQMVALGYVDSCGKSTVHATLKKTNLSLT